MVYATPGQHLPWGYFLRAITTGKPQATTALGSDLFDYYAHHPEEIAQRSRAISSNPSRRAACIFFDSYSMTGMTKTVDEF